MPLFTKYSKSQRSVLMLSTAALLAFLATNATAQTAPTATANAEIPPPQKDVVIQTRGTEDDEVLELSPFQVTAEDDKGYKAGGTLAGTRLRSELRDVAASVSVVTKDFMRDIGVNDIGGILNYTLGTEVTGSSGNLSGASAQAAFVDFDSNLREATPGTRIRGLSSADSTRDYFLTSVPVDGYITDRIDINRGANAMLFGLGSPAGIINNGLIKARTNRNSTEFEAQIARFGSVRATLDHNHVLVKDKLALRVAGLAGDRKYQQEYTFTKDKRAFVTATYTPFRNTTIRASTELARREENRPQVRPPQDGISFWWAYGKPVYNPVTNTGTMLGTPQTVTVNGVTTTLNGINAAGTPNTTYLATGFGRNNGTNMIMFWEDPASNVAGLSALPAGTNALEAQNERYRTGGATGGLMQLRESQVYIRSINGGTTDPRSTFWRDYQLTDPAIFDFYNRTLEGPGKREWADWNTQNISIEHTFLDGMGGVEVAYAREDLDNGFRQPIQGRTYTLYIDINSHLPNGTPNPNVGRPFTSDVGWAGSSGTNREALRATAFFDLDLKKWIDGKVGQVLGRHTFTANFSRQDQTGFSFTGRPTIMGLDHYASENATTPFSVSANSSRRFLGRAVYVGPSLVNASSPAGAGITGVSTDAMGIPVSSVNALYYQSPASGTVPATYQYRTFSAISNGDHIVNTNSGASSNKMKVESMVGVVQSRWLNNTLITSVGARRDSYMSYNSLAATFDPVTGAFPSSPDQIPAILNIDDAQDTTFYGFVFHTPEWVNRRLPLGSKLSFTYNSSDNFRPTSQRYTFTGQAIDPEAGQTKEIGALISMFDGKFELRATRYESTAAKANNPALRSVISQVVAAVDLLIEANSTGFNNDRPAELAAWNTWMQTPIAQQFFDTFFFKFDQLPSGAVQVTSDPRTSQVFALSDVKSEGWEYEAIFNPTRNWRMTMNVGEQKAVRTNTGAELVDFLTAVQPVWEVSAGNLRRTVTGQETIAQYYRGTLLASTLKETLLDGAAQPEVRKWRANFVTNYTFSKGFLKNVRVGGAVRWQDKIAIGYPVINDPATGPRYDVSSPYYGPTETNYDAWVGYSRKLHNKINWSIQINLRNIGVGNELRPLYTQPDGSIAAYSIKEPMIWTVTNSFKF